MFKNFFLTLFLFFSLAVLGACDDTTGSSTACDSVVDCPSGYYCNLDNHICVKGEADIIEKDITNNSNNDLPDIDTDEDAYPWQDVEIKPDTDIVKPDGSVAHCMYVPPPGEFTPSRKCRWNSPTEYPTSDDVVMTPVVANLTDDNGDGIIDTRDIPDIIFISYVRESGCCNVPGILRVVSGTCDATGHVYEHFSVASPVLDNSAGVAIGDIDGDGVPDIVTMKRQTGTSAGTVAFNNDGTVKWESDYPDKTDLLTAAQPSIDDLDGDGIAEIIIGRVVLDGVTGNLKWRGVGGLGINAFMGPMSFAADIDLDGRKEVIAGNSVYRADGFLKWTFDYPDASSPCNSQGYPCDGYAATGNFDDDPYGEVVIVRSGDVWILEHDGSLKARLPIPWDDCSYNEGGPPTVADFDGDGRVEIGVAGADFYSVFDLDCCDSLPDCLNIPAGNTECDAPGIRWHVANNDCSSRVTGSSVFDFDGDGSAEVVYNDEQNFRIFSGMDGSVLFDEPNSSHTRLEYPIIVDVDNDGNAEIVFIENRRNYTGPEHGIEIWGDSSDRWVPTRRIWNQHSYYISNINEDGTIPDYNNPPNWLVYNNFRQNLPDYNVFAAPDLVVTVTDINKANCTDSVEISAEVCNQGDLRVGSGVTVNILNLNDNSEINCTSPLATTQTLEPGDCETLTCIWDNPPESPVHINIRACVDNELPDCISGGSNNECIEDNNIDEYDTDGCNPIGK